MRGDLLSNRGLEMPVSCSDCNRGVSIGHGDNMQFAFGVKLRWRFLRGRFGHNFDKNFLTRDNPLNFHLKVIELFR